MADELTVSGKTYVSSKRASELSAYAQDYIGQLARKGFIEAQRIGGLWHVSMESLMAYKELAEKEKPEPPRVTPAQDPDTLVFFDGKDFISASHAAKITGYAQDYVGQLARSGKILSRQIGNRWYIEREGIVAHKKEKDALLGAVQAQSVGLYKPQQHTEGKDAFTMDNEPQQAYFTYVSEEGDLMPSFGEAESAEEEEDASTTHIAHPIPIRILKPETEIISKEDRNTVSVPTYPLKGRPLFRIPAITIVAATLTVTVIFSLGLLASRKSLYASDSSQNGLGRAAEALTAGAAAGSEWALNLLERWLTSELVYFRTK